MTNPGQYLNYQYLMYNNSQMNLGYPSLSTNPQEEPQPLEVNNQ